MPSYEDTFWDKIILLRDQANGDRTVWLDRRAKIAFGEFAAEMQSCRIDNLYVARRMERIGYVTTMTAIITPSIPSTIAIQRSSVRVTSSSGTMPSGSDRRSGFVSVSANRASW